jgi:hypothetical protein
MKDVVVFVVGDPRIALLEANTPATPDSLGVREMPPLAEGTAHGFRGCR